MSNKKWTNRPHDEKSKIFTFSFVLVLWLTGTVLALIILSLSNLALYSDPQGDNSISITYMLFVFLPLLPITYFLARYMPTIVREISPISVSIGHRGIVKFRGVYTGEIADPGILVMPLGYSFEEFDCKPIQKTTGVIDLVSAEGFPIAASMSAWMEYDDIIKYLSSRPDSLIIPLLTSSLSMAASKNNALSLVGDRERLIKLVKSDIGVDFSEWGLDLYRIAIDFSKIPQSVTELVSLLDELRKRFPDRSFQELSDLIMVSTGKIAVSRNEMRSDSHVSIPSLEKIVEIALQRFS